MDYFGEFPTLSVVIVNWNTRQLLRDCIRSLLADNRRPALEIVVVDNASADGSADMVRGEFPNVVLIVNNENLGFAKACNQGIRASRGRYVLLLNSDTIVAPGTLSHMVNFMDAHPQAGAAGCKILGPDGKVQRACARHLPKARHLLLEQIPLPEWLRRIWPFSYYYVPYTNYEDTREVECLSGAFLMLRREVLERVGLLDEQFFFLAEDLDLCLRLRRAGYRLFYVPDVHIIHLHGESRKPVNRQVGRVSLAVHYQYLFKHYGPGEAEVYKRGMRLIAIPKIFWFGVASVASPAQPHFRERALYYLDVVRWRTQETVER